MVLLKENNDDPKSPSKGFAFINFDTTEAAQKAVEALPNMDQLAAKDKKLYVARAQKKSERQAKLKARFDEVSDRVTFLSLPCFVRQKV